ncbi:MAG TPA: hypothetical protein VF016_02000 [Nitrososphaera sp.]
MKASGKRNAKQIFLKSKKYGYILQTKNASELLAFSNHKRRGIMEALACLSKYLGIYPTFKEIKESYHLKWSSGDSLDALTKRTDTVSLMMHVDAKLLYDAYEAEVEDKIEKEELGVKEGYYGNLPNFVVRLSCIHRIARLTASEIRAYYDATLGVDKEDVVWAIEYVKKRLATFEEVITMMSAPRHASMNSIEEPLERIFRFIAEAKTNGISRSELSKKSKLDTKTLDALVDILLTQERIEGEPHHTSGRPSMLYKVTGIPHR